MGEDLVEVKGPKGTLQTPICSLLNYEIADGHLTITRKDDTRPCLQVLRQLTLAEHRRAVADGRL